MEIAKLWKSTLGIAALIWVAIGVVLVFSPLALAMWIVLGLAGVFALYFAGERFRRWGVGE